MYTAPGETMSYLCRKGCVCVLRTPILDWIVSQWLSPQNGGFDLTFSRLFLSEMLFIYTGVRVIHMTMDGYKCCDWKCK